MLFISLSKLELPIVLYSSAATLCPIIKYYVSKGTVRSVKRTRIISDRWLGYLPLNKAPYLYIHKRINH